MPLWSPDVDILCAHFLAHGMSMVGQPWRIIAASYASTMLRHLNTGPAWHPSGSPR
jgi:hypothetical protein